MERYLFLTALFFVIVGSLHLFRGLAGWPVTIKGYSVPTWFSLVAGLVAFGIAFWGFSLIS